MHDNEEKKEKNTKRIFIDQLLFRLIDKYLDLLAMLFLLILSILVRIHFAPICALSIDYNNCIVPWVEKYRGVGIFHGLGQTIGDYYVPYNVLLGIISLFPWEPYVLVTVTSCLAEYVSAFFLYKIICLLSEHGGKVKRKAAYIAIITLFFPFVMLNGSLWKQCDAIYACFIIVSIYNLLKKKYTFSFIFLAIAFCFKMQTIFVLPLYMLVYMIGAEFSILQFLWIPGMYLLTGIPAVMCGRGVRETYSVYINQTGKYEWMTINAPNLYNFGLQGYQELAKPAILGTMMIFILASVYVYWHRAAVNNKMIFLLAGWIIWTCYMFLPAMHERYDYVAILLISVYMICYDIRNLWIAIIMNICSIITYSVCLFALTGVNMMAVTAAYMLAYIGFTVRIVEMLSNQNKK